MGNLLRISFENLRISDLEDKIGNFVGVARVSSLTPLPFFLGGGGGGGGGGNAL